MTGWFRRFWRRLRGLCPCCGARLQTGLSLFTPVDVCSSCGFWRDYTIDGTAFEHWPEGKR